MLAYLTDPLKFSSDLIAQSRAFTPASHTTPDFTSPPPDPSTLET
jgi:hypothetical protein